MRNDAKLRKLINFNTLSEQDHDAICEALKNEHHLIFIGDIGTGSVMLQAIIRETIEENLNPRVQVYSKVEDSFFHTTASYVLSESKTPHLDFTEKQTVNYIIVDDSVDFMLHRLPEENEKTYIICRQGNNDEPREDILDRLEKALPHSEKPYFVMLSNREENGQRRIYTHTINR